MPVILITGSKGQLGTELKKISGKFFGYSFIFTDVDTLDITDATKTKNFITKNKPDWIINCAAYNYVDKAEEEYETAFRINSEGVKNIADTIRDSVCRFIHFSSDYVFDGRTSEPYRETDKPNPLSKYGESKLEGEKHALKHPWTIVIRTSWLYSVYGNNFVKTILKKAAEKKPLKVVNDQIGSPTWAADLAEITMKIIYNVCRQEIAFNGGIYHYSNEGLCTWYEFAIAIVKYAGLNCTIEPVSTEEFNSIAARPHYSVLAKKKIEENFGIIIPPWETSLNKCITLMRKEKII
ncbi:MAG: dTDP-4-dehydrorhamnose reductase [Bacteroidales bacterium]